MSYTAPTPILNIDPAVAQSTFSIDNDCFGVDLAEELNKTFTNLQIDLGEYSPGNPRMFQAFGFEDSEDEEMYVGIEIFDWSGVDLQIDQNFLNAVQKIRDEINHPLVKNAELWIVPNFY